MQEASVSSCSPHVAIGQHPTSDFSTFSFPSLASGPKQLIFISFPACMPPFDQAALLSFALSQPLYWDMAQLEVAWLQSPRQHCRNSVHPDFDAGLFRSKIPQRSVLDMPGCNIPK